MAPILNQGETLARLRRWAHLVRVLASSADGFLYANNHYAGHGPETIRQLQVMVEGY